MERIRVHTTKITEDIIKLQCGSLSANIYYYNFRTGSFKSEARIIEERNKTWDDAEFELWYGKNPLTMKESLEKQIIETTKSF